MHKLAVIEEPIYSIRNDPRYTKLCAVVDIDLPRERTVDTRELDQYFHLVTTVREALRGKDGGDGGPDEPDGTDARRVAAEGLSA